MKKLIFAILAMMICSGTQAQQLKLEDIFYSSKYYPRSPGEIIHMSDGQHYCTLDNATTISMFEYKTGKKVKTLVEGDLLTPSGTSAPLEIESFVFGEDESKLIFKTESEPLYRYSEFSEYYVLDIKARSLKRVSDKGKQRLAHLSPDGNKVAFVRDNNIFIKDLRDEAEAQITFDGKWDSIINGTTDWVYDEEFDLIDALYWSPDSKNLAFMRFDESRVKQFTLTKYGEIYPENFSYKYPMAGEDNSIVSVWVYNTEGSGNDKLKKMDVGKETDQYIPRVMWTREQGKLAIQRLNRLQNKLEILLADASSGTSMDIYMEENEKYINITDNLIFLNDKKHFIITGDKGKFNNIYMCGTDGTQRLLTKDDADVTEVCGVDEKNKTIYYIVASSPLNREIRSIKLDGSGVAKISSQEGENTASFSAGYDYFMHTWSDANTPPVATIDDNKGKQLVMLESNKGLADNLKYLGCAKKEFFTFTTAYGVELNGYMLKPADFDITKKYPVLMYVYGGPGAQTVLNEWDHNYLWYQYLSKKGYIIVSIDNRGTASRGSDFLKSTYLQLGKLEAEDQMAGAKYLTALPYVDPARVGMWGWSYGGFMTLLCMTKSPEYIFKAGVAVAPVTNWRYYDNIYTERYMRRPKDNEASYDNNSPITFASKFKGKLLMMHGTFDNNVHMQNTMEMADALIRADKQFDLMLYPNKEHSIYGGKTRLHVFTRITDFILQNL
jgi:dipeptidyl-peptidase-4